VPDISASFERFFSSASVKEAPITVTITDVKQTEIKKQDQPAEVKWTLFFDEDPRGLTLNKDRYLTMVQLFGKDTDDWIGKQIKLIFDPKVKFKGQYVGGVAITEAK
jgi:hypothetical protein